PCRRSMKWRRAASPPEPRAGACRSPPRRITKRIHVVAIRQILYAYEEGDRCRHTIARTRIPRTVPGVFDNRRHERREIAVRASADERAVQISTEPIRSRNGLDKSSVTRPAEGPRARRNHWVGCSRARSDGG